ncbi:MAG: tRNA (adenosine(37)-N6)-threonylcarbamoyltransferase complex dimerization subunit type 1 TsaB [Filifactor alocis]|nr:tRNA (adenosine(37)-N6)-threonylcarbamoyltransferase complex dimerization subunit type 1 TsaB [Filifactor alocis]
MKILGIDTSTASLSIALTVDGVLKYELNQNHALTHSERLMPYIATMMKAIGTSMEEVDKFACTVGPGSFTGVRIGVSVANAFSLALNKEVVGISTLEAMAYSHRFCEDVILATTDAQRGNFYAAFYRRDEETPGGLKSLSGESVLSVKELEEKIALYPRVILTGDAVKLWEEVPSNAVKAPCDLCFPRASSVCLLSLQKEGEGYIEPVYLRKSQAELQFEERTGKGL